MVLALMMVLLAAPALAAPDSWDNLGRLRAGQKIEIVDMKLKSVQGEFTGYTPTAVSLRKADGEVAIAREDVFRVTLRQGSHRARNVLLGLGIGAASGIAAGAIAGKVYHESGETGAFMLVTMPIGAGLGALAGAALPAGEPTIYRARR